MPITSDSPAVVAAVAEKTYDKWWVVGLNIDGSLRADNKVVLIARLRRCQVDGDGVPTFHPTDAVKELIISDLFGLAATNSSVNTALTDVTALIGTIAKANGVIV